MKVNENEFTIVTDIDDTIVMHNIESLDKLEITNPYDGTKYWLTPHHEHIALIRQYKAKGYYITAWSNNGARWAETVIKAVGLEDYVDECRCKPLKCIDDKIEPQYIVGNHVYIPFVPKRIYCGSFQSDGQGGNWGNGQETFFIKGNI